MKVNAIKLVLVLLVSVIIGCTKNVDENQFLSSTLDEVLDRMIVDLRYNIPSSYEEFLDGELREPILKKPDSLSKLLVLINTPSIKFDTTYKNFIPLEYQFSVDPSSYRAFEYLPNSKKSSFQIKDYSVELISKNGKKFDQLKTKENYGGILFVSEVRINKEGDKGVIFAKTVRNRWDALISYILIEKNKGTWEVSNIIDVARG